MSRYAGMARYLWMGMSSEAAVSRAHVNWFPVTVTGHVSGRPDHNKFGDDDYTFTFFSDEPGSPLSVNPPRDSLHVEFDSDETIDHFKSTEWLALNEAVDRGDDELAT